MSRGETAGRDPDADDRCYNVSMKASLLAQLAAARRRIRWAWVAATAGLVVPSVAAGVMIVAGLAWLTGRPLAWWWFVVAPVALLALTPLTAIRHEWFAIWAMWTLMMALLALVLGATE